MEENKNINEEEITCPDFELIFVCNDCNSEWDVLDTNEFNFTCCPYCYSDNVQEVSIHEINDDDDNN